MHSPSGAHRASSAINVKAARGDEESDSEKLPTLILGIHDPYNHLRIQRVAQEVSLPIEWVLVPRRKLLAGLQELYGVGGDTLEQILSGQQIRFDELDLREDINVIDDAGDEEASVVRFVNQFIRNALDQRATDIHVEPLPDNLRIRYRIDGELQDVTVPETSNPCRQR